MPEVDINDIAEKGVVKDEPGYQLPPEVWTTAENMRSVDGGMVSMKGWAQVFGTPGTAPHFALPVVTPAAVFWPYVSLTKAFVWNGSSHTDITRAAGGDYNAGETRNWNGALFASIPIFNNGIDVPQFWAAPTIATKLANLTNWPGADRAAVLRAFGAYLIAINYTEGANNFPHLVRWSSSVNGPGQLPSSWDPTNTAIDTGEYDLPDINSGVLREAMQLGSKMFLFKDQSTWTMRYVGGRAIFAFDTFLDTSGILAPRCVTITGDGKKQVVATQDDIIIHNGSGDPVSILDKKMRRTLFNNIDTTNYLNCFMFTDAENKEVIFAYPEPGIVQPNRGLVFNYRNGALTETNVSYRNAISGRVEAPSGETWNASSGPWDTDTQPWSLQERRKVVLCDPDNVKFQKYNTGYTRNGASYACTLQRVGLSLVGRKRSGEWIVDHEVMKFVDRMWPKCQGAPHKIRVGAQILVNGPVTWGSYFDFDPATGVVADFTLSGRAVGVEFFLPIAANFRVDGYKLSVMADGNF